MRELTPIELEPGIYHDLSFEDYCALPYLNQSVLKLMDTEEKYGATPLHAKAAFDGEWERDDTEAKKLGRAEHCWICDGEEEFRRRYRIAPACCEAILSSGNYKGNRCTNSPTRFVDGQWRCGTHSKGAEADAIEFTTADDLERIKAMAEAVRSHEINAHLRRKGWSECTIVYDVPVTFYTKGIGEHGPTATRQETLLRHKIRLDRLVEPSGRNPHLIVDFKRMQTGEGRRAAREAMILACGWDVQAGMYTEAVKRHFNVSRCHYAWVFVEEDKPHDVTWFEASEDTLRIGADKLWRYRQEWARCDYQNDFPGYARGDQPKGGLNGYYVKKYLERFADDTGQLASEVGQRASA